MMLKQGSNLSTDTFLEVLHNSPLEDSRHATEADHFMSVAVGTQVKALFHWKQLYKSIGDQPFLFGPISIWARYAEKFMDTFVTGQVVNKTKEMVREGLPPDIFTVKNNRIEIEYADLLKQLCGVFIVDGKFSQQSARELIATDQGRKFLKDRLAEFAALESQYNSRGLTRLLAMRELLESLLVVITEEKPTTVKLPFYRKRKDGTLQEFEEYLSEARKRLENLYKTNAFSIVEFAKEATGGIIGYLPYEIVEGSRLHSVTLRHYLPLADVKPNGRVLYLPSPLINRPEIYDLGDGKSVIQGGLKMGYEVYLVDHGDPEAEESDLGLDFYGKVVHDTYIRLIKERHPGKEIQIMAYCMAGTLILPYLARRAEERKVEGKSLDIKSVVLMASPVKFDDEASGHKAMRQIIVKDYDFEMMKELYGEVNVPSSVIEFGMQDIQPGVGYMVTGGFYQRAADIEAIWDAAPFLYWLSHGTKFPARAHRQWLSQFFIDDGICRGTFRLPSHIPELDNKPVDMNILNRESVAILDYKGTRDPIAPPGSCIAAELWGRTLEYQDIADEVRNRSVEKNIGHIFVVSTSLLKHFLITTRQFYGIDTDDGQMTVTSDKLLESNIN